MSTDIGAIQGLIELKDEFTGKLDVAESALKHFSEQNQASLNAVAEAGGIVAAAFIAVGVAVVELGSRGAEVQNVEATLEHFAGGAKEAADIMQRLKASTLGTVDEFMLAKDAAHLLSAGVKLTAEDFSVLGGAAELLKKRGLGDTAATMELVSNAMVTGRTRALSMALGVVDVSNAEEAYAKKLGVTKAELSTAGIAEAKRQAIMDLLTRSVKEAGEQHRDFGEQIKAAEVKMKDWLDDLAQAVATSPALAAGMKTMGSALSAAFGGESQDTIKTIMEYVKSFAILTVNVGLGAIEFARVINVAWSAVKTIILGTETTLVGVAAGVAGVVAMTMSAAASLPGASEGIKKMAASARDMADGGMKMTESLAAETKAAAQGMIGNSDFDRTLDKLGGTLVQVKDAMDGAAASTEKGGEATNIAANNASKLAKAQNELANSMVNRHKIEEGLWKIEEKSINETTQIWNEYYNLRAKLSGTTLDGQKADIQKWFDDEVSKLDGMDRNWQEHYNAIKAVADEKLAAVGGDWDTVKDKSINALQQQYEKALNTYNMMTSGSQTFSRTALQEQIDKIHAAADAMRGFGADAVKAQQAAATAAEVAKAKIEAETKALQDAAAAARALGNTQTYDLSTAEGMAHFKALNPAAIVNASLDYFKTHTLQDAINAGLVNLYGGYNSGSTGGNVGSSGGAGPTSPSPTTPQGNTFAGGGIPPGGGGGGGVAPIAISVSGVWDPATIAAMTSAISSAQLASSGRKFGV